LQAAADRHPLKRIGTVQDIADAANYLMNASWVSGQILTVAGGL
jgi:NAD(P)-dependent dehydrogenase (short-subunit alcohol dehydrogenase family)